MRAFSEFPLLESSVALKTLSPHFPPPIPIPRIWGQELYRAVNIQERERLLIGRPAPPAVLTPTLDAPKCWHSWWVYSFLGRISASLWKISVISSLASRRSFFTPTWNLAVFLSVLETKCAVGESLLCEYWITLFPGTTISPLYETSENRSSK